MGSFWIARCMCALFKFRGSSKFAFCNSNKHKSLQCVLSCDCVSFFFYYKGLHVKSSYQCDQCWQIRINHRIVYIRLLCHICALSDLWPVRSMNTKARHIAAVMWPALMWRACAAECLYVFCLTQTDTLAGHGVISGHLPASPPPHHSLL